MWTTIRSWLARGCLGAVLQRLSGQASASALEEAAISNPDSPNAGILAYSGELALSFRHVGLGISVFGAVGEARRSYSAVGLVVEGGRIH